MRCFLTSASSTTSPSGCVAARSRTTRPRPWRPSSSSSLPTSPRRSPVSSPVACSNGSRWPGPSSTGPDVLLLDEPLGALDLKLRRQMQIELKQIQSEVGITFVHVTHDQEEAMTMADTIAVMNAGRLEQVADPATLYEHPTSTFVANFLGQSNLLKATVKSRAGATAELDVHGVSLRLPVDRLKADHHGAVARGAPREAAAGRAHQWGRCRPERGPSRRTQPAHRCRHRRLVHRSGHQLPGPAAVGPGAHGGAAERRYAACRSQGRRSPSAGLPSTALP